MIQEPSEEEVGFDVSPVFRVQPFQHIFRSIEVRRPVTVGLIKHLAYPSQCQQAMSLSFLLHLHYRYTTSQTQQTASRLDRLISFHSPESERRIGSGQRLSCTSKQIRHHCGGKQKQPSWSSRGLSWHCLLEITPFGQDRFGSHSELAWSKSQEQ